MREPFIILEGPDCVGKTTLSKVLAKKWGAMLYHATARGKLVDAMCEYQLNILDNADTALRELDQAVVLDRHWPSEVVYGQVYRPDNQSGFKMGDYAKRIRNLNGIYVFCDRPDVVEAHAAEQDPDHPYDMDSFRRIVTIYRETADTMRRQGYPVVNYCIHEEGRNMNEFAKILQTISHELNSVSERRE